MYTCVPARVRVQEGFSVKEGFSAETEMNLSQVHFGLRSLPIHCL